MPSPLSSNASAPTPGVSGNASTARTSSSDSRKDFGQMLQGGSASTGATGAADTASSPAKQATTPSTSDGNPGKTTPRPSDGEAAATDATTSTPAVPATSAAADDKDAPASADDAPWPPLGLAGLMLAVPTGVDPTPALPPPTASDAEAGALPSAAPALPAAAVAANAAQGAAAPATSASASAAGDPEASGLPLPELVLGGKALDRADDGDSLQIGDRAPLQPPLPAALQDLKAALASNAVFNGEPTPKPVLGDDGFDQAIGARIGWLADQKIGHAHIRLNPEDLGPVDVRLQMNGDKVHASFSSPHVDVRQALESSLPRLRELLGEQGFQLAHADVGQQHSGDGNPGSQTAGGGRGGDGEPSLGDTTMSASQLIRQRGLLDAYA